MMIWKPKLSDLIALAAAVAIVAGFFSMLENAKRANLEAKRISLEEKPASEWIEIRSINIPNFKVGTIDAPMVFDRNVLQPFDGFMTIEIHQVKDGVTNDRPVCDNWNFHRYAPIDPKDPGAQSERTDVTLDWFMGKHCDLPVGQYIIKANLKITADEGVTKHKPVSSNIFQVTGETTQ